MSLAAEQCHPSDAVYCSKLHLLVGNTICKQYTFPSNFVARYEASAQATDKDVYALAACALPTTHQQCGEHYKQQTLPTGAAAPHARHQGRLFAAVPTLMLLDPQVPSQAPWLVLVLLCAAFTMPTACAARETSLQTLFHYAANALMPTMFACFACPTFAASKCQHLSQSTNAALHCLARAATVASCMHSCHQLDAANDQLRYPESLRIR